MRTRSLALALGLTSLLALESCSTGGDDEDDAQLFVVSCSLGCSNGNGGEQVFCSIQDIFLNQEISILFSVPIDITSVNSSSFRVTDVANGTSPEGQFFGDPLNPRRLIFRPSLMFSENGTPIFGFDPNTSYEINIPGQAQGDSPPFILSSTGRPNQSRLRCTVKTTDKIVDPVPGAPNAQLFVDVVTGYDANGNPNKFKKNVLVTKDPELVDVWRDTNVTFRFGDIMNVATLLDPSTGKAPFIKVEVDDDGNLSTMGDRTKVEGHYSYQVDQLLLNTTLLFNPDLPFPSAGTDAPQNPRRIAVSIPISVQDLAGNAVGEGGGTSAFVPELSQFGETVIGSDFVDASEEDADRSGADWAGATPNALAFLVGGGSGRLGDLHVPNGSLVTLNTDGQTFPLTQADGLPQDQVLDLIGNPDAVNFPDTLGNFPDSITVTDGVFEFTSLIVEPGAALRIVGQNPARVYVRGPVVVEASGLIDLTGVSPGTHDSAANDSPEAELPTPVNAANGGDGGFGADRFDMRVNCNLHASGNPENDVKGCDNVASCNPYNMANCPPGGLDPNGRQGMGVGRQVGFGGGPGGSSNPFFPDPFYPGRNSKTDDVKNNDHRVNFNVVGDFHVSGADECRSLNVGASGGGGAYALDGGTGTAEAFVPIPDDTLHGTSNSGPDTSGGDAKDVGLETPEEDNLGYDQRLLRWQAGHLLGGSGGGGGANHPFGTRANGHDLSNPCIGPNSIFDAWHDHTGARGGFGGGALHLASGKRIQVNGRIDASGGDGGSARTQSAANDFGAFAAPGGGGSGGAIKLQSLVVDLADSPAGRLDVSGGMGGASWWSNGVGGMGSAGLVRIEDVAGLATRPELAKSILPFEPADDSLAWVSVDNGTNPADGPGWETPSERPGSISASSSCWLRPSGNFFSLAFVDDDEDDNTGDPDAMAWNMDVLWQPMGQGEQVVPFRGANAIFMNSFENEFGKELGTDGMSGTAAPIVVRFQGARTTGAAGLCDFDLNDPFSQIEPGSLTPWVDHPFLFEDVTDEVINIVRFVVIFDSTDDGAADTPGQVLENVNGITNLRVRVIPD